MRACTPEKAGEGTERAVRREARDEKRRISSQGVKKETARHRMVAFVERLFHRGKCLDSWFLENLSITVLYIIMHLCIMFFSYSPRSFLFFWKMWTVSLHVYLCGFLLLH